MPDSQTLLAHLALKLASHPENIAVEALGHILSTSPAAVRALEDVLQTGGSEVGKIAQVRTQDSDEEGGIPDLAGRDADGRKRMLIEAKFWAGLTERQPVKYLKHLLKQDQPSVLLFVAPAKRFESLWNELCRLVNAEELELVPGRTEEANLRSAVVDGKCHLMLTSWATLLDRMASRAGTTGESHVKCDIQQLQGLAQQMDEDAFLPLRQDELGPEFSRRVLHLQRLIEDATSSLRAVGIVDTTGLNVASQAEGYGRYMRLGGAQVWFGVRFDLWARYRDVPLWLYFYEELAETRHRLESLRRGDPSRVIENPRALFVPIYLPVGVEYDAVLDAVVTRLKEVANLINPAN